MPRPSKLSTESSASAIPSVEDAAPAPEPKLSPMMERYLEVKRETPGTILFFRMGDFYELFYEDAVVAAKILGLTLTSRDKGSSNPIPMAGFPFHALDNYLRKLIQAGHRAAICEQVEDPKLAKGLVRREVTRIVTPGTLTDEGLLDPKQSNFLASIFPLKDEVGLAWLELSTGRFVCATFPVRQLKDELVRISPAECIVSEAHRREPCALWLTEVERLVVTNRPPWSFSPQICLERLNRHFQTLTLEGFGIDGESLGAIAAGALLDYVQETQKSALGHIERLELYESGHSLLIDEATRRSLELTRTLRGGDRTGSLLAVLDETVTPMGARLLAEWLSNPLTNPLAIERRLDAVAELVGSGMLTRDVREQLEQVYDLQRLTARIATGRASPRDLGCLVRSLQLLPKLKSLLCARKASLLNDLEQQLDLCAELRAQIETALAVDPPLTLTEGGIIREGFNSTLDELRDLARGGKEWIAAYQRQEIERTGITSLKVGFNKVFGYFLEITAANYDRIPADYIRKQTLKNQERFITPALKEYEDKVLRAEGQAIVLEQELFQALRERVAGECRRLQRTADALAGIDVLCGLSTLAVLGKYCRPEIVSEPVLQIAEGRHPVLDRLKAAGEFVPNDTSLASSVRSGGESQPFIQLITGPNMAGKSTYIRQTALLTIMAQMGSFVPAKAARIGVADRVFARVGASDELAKGQSTFMVEMTETARILNSATDRSLVILDEIGRGTSTYDGISLAWAITEFLHDEIRCRTLFATHYHELTELAQNLTGVSNWNVAVREHQGELIFLHRILPGAADKSYGIHVARLAGVPRDVIDRAAVILKTLENDHHDDLGRVTIPTRKPRRKIHERQQSLFATADQAALTLSPTAALEELQQLRDASGK